MTDNTISERAERHRKLRQAQGWRKVAVWAASDKDAEDIRRYAARKRAKVEALTGLSEKVEAMTKNTEERIAEAIAQHGSSAYLTPTGAVLTLMSKLTEEGDLAGFATTVNALAHAKPANASFVLAAVPPKIQNYLVVNRGIDAGKLVKWAARNPQWTERLKRAVRNPERFVAVVDSMAAEIAA